MVSYGTHVFPWKHSENTNSADLKWQGGKRKVKVKYIEEH